MKSPIFYRVVERWSFRASVISGIVAAIAGGLGLELAAILSGCLAAAAPIAARISSGRLSHYAEVAANIRVTTAERALEDLKLRLAPRAITPEQSAIIKRILCGVAPFSVGVNHNRREVEPSTYSEQIRAALRAGGIEAGWFGGSSNATLGIEISGPDSANKKILVSAFLTAAVAVLPVEFSDDPDGQRGIEVWVGTHPGLG